jgi:hypothetical protein
MKWPTITDAELGPILATFPHLEISHDVLTAAAAADWAEERGMVKAARYLRRIAEKRQRSPRFRWRFPDRVSCWAALDEPGALIFFLWGRNSIPRRRVKYKVFDWETEGAEPIFPRAAIENLRKRMVWQLAQRSLARS